MRESKIFFFSLCLSLQVRSEAAVTFAHLHTALGAMAVDEILPGMLVELESGR